MDPPLFRQRLRRGEELRHAIKITACGGMIGTAVLFPLANVQGLWFRAVTLSIFIIGTLAFHALHIEPFIRFGPYTVAAGLVFLLVAVLSAGPSRKDLIPWLPLFIAAWSLITVATYEVSQHIGYRRVTCDEEDFASRASMDRWSGWSPRTLSTLPGSPPWYESNRGNALYFARGGPSSRTSHRTNTSTTDISLSSIEGQCQPHWDALTQSLFTGHLPSEDTSQAETHAWSTSQGEERHPEADSDLDSTQGTVESDHPLLGPQ